MNPVEIEKALSTLAAQPFDPGEFPFSFLAAIGNREVTLKRLRKGDTNKSDVPGGLLQHNNIHLAVCDPGEVARTLTLLRNSPKTAQSKVKVILATDGDRLEAEDLISGEPLECPYPEFADQFTFFLPLAGITTVKEIKESAIDIKATVRLNKLYVELLKTNEEWATDERRPEMNHFMARLVFCFFAEDTDIFQGSSIFTRTMEQMTDSDGSNTHEVLDTIFQAMNMPTAERAEAKVPAWAARFPYVNGGLFSGSTKVPKFTRTARSYLLRAGELNWSQINPDIFGSMIQAVAADEERGSFGMHYTSVPNILKVLNPLFLDDLRAQLEAAADNKAKLLNLRKRMSRIRVFDPACGSGNFLVIAYKQMREIEVEINRRRGEPDLRTEIPLTNFRGVELHDFPAEIARLALVIAEFQCDVLYRGQKEALAGVLPLNAKNWITCGNSLRTDWLKLMDVDQRGVKIVGDDLFSAPKEQAAIDFVNEGGETYICGNPPYAGLSSQTDEQKDDLRSLFEGKTAYWKSFDYVMGWFWKASEFMQHDSAKTAFVSTNSICQGQLVPMFWPLVLEAGTKISFAHTSFKWNNLATNNAGVSVVIIGMSRDVNKSAVLYSTGAADEVIQKSVANINAYLVSGPDIVIQPESKPLFDVPAMVWGNKPVDGGNLLMTADDARHMAMAEPEATPFLRPLYGSQEFIDGKPRYCIWVKDEEFDEANAIAPLRARFDQVRTFRLESKAKETRPASKFPHRFRQIQGTPGEQAIIIPIHSSETRPYLPAGLLPAGSIISNAAFAIYDPSPLALSILVSRLHLTWIAAICGKLETRYRYSNTLGWNTFPVPTLTDQQRDDLTKCAEDILLARESSFPATIAKLYDPEEEMPQDLRRAHEKNDEVLERIYIGRLFRNDTERLEKLYDLYIKMTANVGKPKKKGAKAK